MDSTIGIISIILSAVAIIFMVAIYLYIRKNKESGDNKDIIDAFQKMTDSSNRSIYEYLTISDATKKNELTDLNLTTATSFAELRKEIEEKLRVLTEINEKKLVDIQKEVSEKLEKAVDKSFTSSFESVEKSISELNKKLFEMQALATGVEDLNKTLAGTKSKGDYGELTLEMILEDILSPDQYKKQYKLKASEAVDFAIVFPGKENGSEVLLPIDAKLPTAAYTNVLNARAKSNKTLMDAGIEELKKVIIKEAKSISSKYIQPPKTTDFAVMFLGSEGLYAEVVNIPGLVQDMQKEQKIIIAGPSTIAAMIHSFKMGFRTMQLQKNSIEIVKLMRAFQKDFEVFGREVGKSQDYVDKLMRSIGEISNRSLKICAKLEEVEKYKPDEIEKG